MRLFLFLFLFYFTVGLIAHAFPLAEEVGSVVVSPQSDSDRLHTLELERRRVEYPIVPVQIHIPALHLSATVEAVPQNVRGHMSVPSRYARAAWYRDGALPGASGSAVIAGHLDDSKGVPGVFVRLSELKIGDRIYVEDAHGAVRVFIVDSAVRYDFDYAPTEELFRTEGESVLRLVTCDGLWSEAQKNYAQRLVVTALPLL